MNALNHLTLPPEGGESSVNPVTFMTQWGIDSTFEVAGGVTDFNPQHSTVREVKLMQRETSKVGKNLAKSTGWIHWRELSMRGVTMLGGCGYVKIDDAGLHVYVEGEPQVLDVDHVVICARQEPLREL